MPGWRHRSPLSSWLAGEFNERIPLMHASHPFNELIPDEEFRPDGGAAVTAVPPEPLTAGYTPRFLNVIDGTSGRMSVRWGMKGPKGTSSSGLN
jgi:hypothetical protein